VEREQRYTKEIRATEEALQKAIADKENLQKTLAVKTAELQHANEDHSQCVRDAVSSSEKNAEGERELRQQLQEIVQDKRELQDRLALGNKDMEMLQQENERLRHHVKAFQRDVNEILI